MISWLADLVMKWGLPAGAVGDEIRNDLAREADDRAVEHSRGAVARWRLVEAIKIAVHLSLRPKHEWLRSGGTASRRMRWNVLRDVRFGIRMLGRRPGFTAVAVLTLALGIGANTTIFTVVNAVLMKPLQVEDPHRLMSVFTSYSGGNRYGITSFPDFEDLRSRNDVFSGLAAQVFSPMGLVGPDGSEVVLGQLVSWDYFSVLGVQAAMGRTFVEEEGQTPGTHPVAVLSHASWQRRFGADPGIVGREVPINDFPFTVVGVAPEGFGGLSTVLKPEVWVPLMMVERAFPYSVNLGGRADPWLYLVGRLGPGVSPAQAQSAVDVLSASLRQENPALNEGKSVTVVPAGRTRILPDATIDAAERLSAILMGVVGLVLLIACFNVANLHLARASSRQREILLRLSLGASRWSVVRLLLTESLMISVAAGMVSLLLAQLVLGPLTGMLSPMAIPLEVDIGLDGRVFTATALLTVLTGVVFGLAPALHALRSGQFGACKDQDYSVTRSGGKARLQNSLVGAQVAVSLLLLVGAGLLLRSMQNVLAIHPGYDLRNGVVLRVDLAFSRYDEEESQRFFRELLDRAESLAGTRAATLAAFLPLGQGHGRHYVRIGGYSPEPGEFMTPRRNMVGPGYFEIMGIPVVQGRGIDGRDREDSQQVVVINETMARRYWPGRDPIGGTVRADLGVARTVVGVMKDGKYGALNESPEPYFVIPLSQAPPMSSLHLIVETAGDPRGMIQPLLREVRALDPNLPSLDAMTVREHLDLASAGARIPTVLVSSFGLLALALALVGVFGVMSYAVSERVREFGIRIAMGAETGRIVRVVLVRGLRTTMLGVGAGVVLAVVATRALAGMLYGVSTLDPLVLLTVSLALIAVGMVACYLPARRAAGVDPVTALRAE